MNARFLLHGSSRNVNISYVNGVLSVVGCAVSNRQISVNACVSYSQTQIE